MLKPNNKIGLFFMMMAAFFSAESQAGQRVCVYDPLGSAGDIYALAKDYALAAKRWGADIELKPYKDEKAAAEDLKNARCDGAIISGLRGRQFNTFTGSLDAIGALSDPKMVVVVYQLLAKPQLAADMVKGNFEIAGIGTIGPAYLFVNDRSMNTLAKAGGKKIGVFDFDKAQARLAQRIGARAVAIDLSNAGAKFNNKEIDILPSPMVVFKPFELNRGLGTFGAIVRFPLMQVSANFVIRKDQFPAGFGQKSRSWVASQLNRSFSTIAKYEKDIPAKYWVEVPENDKVGYIKIMREARIALIKEGIYDKKMMGLLKKVRCQTNPLNYECSLTDE